MYSLKKHLKSTAAGVVLVGGLAVSTAAFADQVTLKSTDGTINVVGEFVEFADDSYIVRTALGDLRINASRVVCEGAACPTFSDVTAGVNIIGSDTIGLGMMPLLMTGYAAANDADAELTNPATGQALATIIDDGGFGDEVGSYLVSSTDDNAAFEALLNGDAQIGMSSRRITKDEARALRADGAGSMVSPRQERIIAVDNMVVVTHPSNPVDTLDMQQLRGIFSGEYTNWSQLGGPDRDINVIMSAKGSASYEFFSEYLYGEERPQFRPAGIANDDQALSNTIYHDKNAIGYLGYAFQRGAKPMTLVNECGIATSPDAFSAKTEEYALNRRMYLYNRADTLDPAGQAFLDFVTSDEADGVIGKSGFIDLGITRRAQSPDEGRGAALQSEVASYDAGFEAEVMQEMLTKMGDYDRLSTTFRFRTGSSKVDERGKLDMQRLINYLERQEDGTSVTIVGFTDDVGAFEANRRLSLGRAETVADLLKDDAQGRIDHINLNIAGFGEVAPSACNVSDRGRSINRRVEVWIESGQQS